MKIGTWLAVLFLVLALIFRVKYEFYLHAKNKAQLDKIEAMQQQIINEIKEKGK